jgi:hypothetical protein
MIATKLLIEEIPVPKGHIMVTVEKTYGPHISKTQLFFDKPEFLEFFKPLVTYYEGIEHASPTEQP